MSSTSFPSIHGEDSLYPSPGPGSGQPSQRVERERESTSSSTSRARTKSSSGASGPLSQYPAQQLYAYDVSSGRAAQGAAPHSAPRPSRIPTSPRSKSNLGARPDPPSPPSEQVPTMPSEYSNSSLYRPGMGRDDSAYGQGRYSPELQIERGVGNEDLRDQLPPFRLRPDEAMRIAERGHDLREARGRNEVEEEDGYFREGEAEGDARRKRRQTMRTTSKPSVPMADDSPPLPASTSGLPRSATGTLGLGLPSSRTKSGSAGGANSRSTSSHPANHLSASGSTSSSTPRSASLNMLSQSGSRLGIAAHLVPPESTYTPPKGQSWDEVVLPTVAKKLGLGDSPSPAQGGGGDLAVEWDKNGVPVKWIKRESVNRLGGPGEASRMMKNVYWISHVGQIFWLTRQNGLPNDDYITRQHSPSPHPLGSSTKSAFSPTFEPSPDNPLNPSRLLPRTSHSSLTPSPSPTPRQQRSNEQLQPHPLRTSSGQWASLRTTGPPSPAPFSQMQSLGPRQPSFDNSLQSRGSPARKQSTLRKTTGQNSPQRSTDNLKNGEMYFTNPRPEVIRAPGPGGEVFDGRRMYSQSQYGQLEQSTWSPASAPDRRAGKDDTHGKGCACVIM
jgi:hypothetical protein